MQGVQKRTAGEMKAGFSLSPSDICNLHCDVTDLLLFRHTKSSATGSEFLDGFFFNRKHYECSSGSNRALQKLVSVRTVLEVEVSGNKKRVPSRTYVEWRQRVNEIEVEVRNTIAQYSDQRNQWKFPWSNFERRDFRKDMKRMHERVENLEQESKEMRDKMLVDRPPKAIVKEKAPDIRKYETLQKPLEKILNWLREKEVKRIGIYGIVGIGKSTIMKNLNNHDEVAVIFDIVIWLKVSKEEGKARSQEDLQGDIANRLKLTMAGTSNAEEVAQRISTELEGKKYLLLLDGVEECLNLSKIGIPDSNNGSKIVLTTRQHLVSYKMHVDKEIKAACLSPHEARMMFQDVLGNEDLTENSEIARLADKVCRECGGLPLLIEKVASTFKFKKDKTLWIDGWNCWMMWPLQECEGIREVYELLRFCYNDLKDKRYQKCFLFGALYPEDSDINTDSLLECWEAEDLLVHENDARKKRILAGVSILLRLKNVSLIEEGKKRDHVTMNQFIRQAALYISGKDHPECKLMVTSTEFREPADEISWNDKNRISLGASELDKLPDSPHCSLLSTLFLPANKGLEIIPPEFFKHMKNLRVLDLSDTSIKSLPSLQFLSKLKVLHLNNCKQLLELPSRINGINNLEFLDIHGSGIIGIPSGFGKLKLLRHLWISFGNGTDAQGVSFNYNMISKLFELEQLVIDFEQREQWTDEVAKNIVKEVDKLENFKKLRVSFPQMIADVLEVDASKSVHFNASYIKEEIMEQSSPRKRKRS
ncbi:hypothetical protein Vadar_005218 [Vaccinium darrowii]|uniref:Uncharacterized protein n=1 Tax=Vaccinium darrowii TaxID=229202 RepID=A0ACB7WY67_9ERIC|nr:hypothetical protein Vadar_005218 [Vaccinium darrowii]